MTWIEQALSAIDEMELQRHNLAAIPIARHGAWVNPPKPEHEQELQSYLNPCGEALYRQDAKQEIDPLVAETFLELSAEGKLPPWAIALIDARKFRAAAA